MHFSHIIRNILPQRQLWQLGTGQTDSTIPKKKGTKVLEYTQEYNQLLKIIASRLELYIVAIIAF